MKTMTCKQLAGACDLEFHANSFNEMGEMSKQHASEMMQKGDQPHIDAMNKMMELMKTPGAVEKWFEEKQKEFDAIHEDL